MRTAAAFLAITGRTTVSIVLQWLHVLFAVFWFGSTLYANVVLWPEMRRSLPADQGATLLGGLRSGRARHITLTLAIGTVGLGILRGIAGGVLERLDTVYGATFIAATVVGVLMVAWVVTRGFGRPNLPSWLFLAGFFVMLTLMIAMRFGY
jgi:uncharacterized membrane protein